MNLPSHFPHHTPQLTDLSSSKTLLRDRSHGEASEADEAQVSHKEMALLHQADPQHKLHSRRKRGFVLRPLQQRQGRDLQGASRRLRGEVAAAVHGELRRGGAPHNSRAGGQVVRGRRWGRGGGLRGGAVRALAVDA